MRLRNKKTGEILELCCHRDGDFREQYNSLAELNEEWEDYGPTEPLIKDEKVRKAVRAWAEANNLMNNKLQIVPLKPSDGAYNDSGIICNGSVLMSITLIHGIGRGLRDSKKQYTITELCGEEKE